MGENYPYGLVNFREMDASEYNVVIDRNLISY